MTGNSNTAGNGVGNQPPTQGQPANYYMILEVVPTASVQEIRLAYRKLSRLYHPDTTTLPASTAVDKFQQLNEAYATLNDPKLRLAYNQKLGLYRKIPSPPIPAPPVPREPVTRAAQSRSAYLDPSDRPLSAGEVFALFILGLTFVGCLVLAIAIGITRGEKVLQPLPQVVQTESAATKAELPESLPTDPPVSLPPTLPAPVIPTQPTD